MLSFLTFRHSSRASSNPFKKIHFSVIVFFSSHLVPRRSWFSRTETRVFRPKFDAAFFSQIESSDFFRDWRINFRWLLTAHSFRSHHISFSAAPFVYDRATRDSLITHYFFFCCLDMRTQLFNTRDDLCWQIHMLRVRAIIIRKQLIIFMFSSFQIRFFFRINWISARPINYFTNSCFKIVFPYRCDQK